MSRYLFLRILEACNAGCFMCDFRHSKDTYRLSIEEYTSIVDRSIPDGLEYVRFTGGEPLKHNDIVKFIEIANERGIKTSIISNGYYLPEMCESLKSAGLSQIIVSIDGASAKTHNRYRNTKDLFERAVDGLIKAKNLGIKTRVNTVAGRHNYLELVELQELFTDLGVEQWELSALKMDKPLVYPKEVRERIISDLYDIYTKKPQLGFLSPMGKVWCGQTVEEQTRYFDTGVPPRPDNVCKLVHNMRYFDAKNGYLYPCSLLPHRVNKNETGVHMNAYDFSVLSEKMVNVAGFFEKNGPKVCTGCSATAAGYEYNGQEWGY